LIRGAQNALASQILRLLKDCLKRSTLAISQNQEKIYRFEQLLRFSALYPP